MSATLMRTCWSCQKRIPRVERYCDECGADQWNPPQGTNVSGHSWRTNDYARSETAPTSTATITAAGVAIIATLLMLSSFFLVTIWLFGVVNPPEGDFTVMAVDVVTFENYVSLGRAMLAAVVAVAVTVVTWSGVLNMVGDD